MSVFLDSNKLWSELITSKAVNCEPITQKNDEEHHSRLEIHVNDKLHQVVKNVKSTTEQKTDKSCNKS